MQSKETQSVIHRTFTAGQAAKAAGIPYHQVNYWANTKLIEPSVKLARGSDTCRVYDFRDLVALRVAGELRAAGVSTRELRRVVQYLRDEFDVEQPLAAPYLLVPHHKDVCLLTADKLISALRQPGQVYLVFAFNEVIEQLMTVAKKLKPPTRGKAKVAVA